MDFEIDYIDYAIRLGLAVAFGAVVGWEREAKGRTAGLRTHMLVALGAAGFTLVGIEYFHAMGDGYDQADADLLRMVQAIVGGIGFLGAGAIIEARGKVRGLTTAAGMWTVAAVGMAAGSGLVALAAIMVGFSLVILSIVRFFESRLVGSKSPGAYETEEEADRKDTLVSEPRNDV